MFSNYYVRRVCKCVYLTTDRPSWRKLSNNNKHLFTSISGLIIINYFSTASPFFNFYCVGARREHAPNLRSVFSRLHRRPRELFPCKTRKHEDQRHDNNNNNNIIIRRACQMISGRTLMTRAGT